MRTATTALSGISLRQLLPQGKFFGANDIYLQSCCGDWRECQSNDLFVALVGDSEDGHEAAGAAIERGATGVLCERLLPIDVPQCIVDDTRRAYSEICQTLAGNPSQYLNTIGITGSDGKTTIAHLLQSIFVAADRNSSVTSSWETTGKKNGRNDKNKRRLNELTPSELANWMCDMALAGHEHAIVETSSLQLANHQISGVSFDSVVISNIRRDHLEYHNSVENYRQIKLRILQHLKPNGLAAINLDDPVSNSMIGDLDIPVISFAIKQQANVTATPIEQFPSEQSFLITAGNEAIPVRTSIIGIGHIYNCLAAAAIALTNDIDLATIVKGLENVRRMPGRMDRVECGQDFSVFVDAAQSPRRVSAALHAIKKTTKGKVIVVADTGQISRGQRKECGRILEKNSSLQVITSAKACLNSRLEYAHQMLDGFRESAKARIIPNRMEAIEWALSQAKPGDSVLISGCGAEPVCFLDDGRWELTDREICQAWLYQQPISPIAEKSSTQNIFRIEDFRR